MLMEGNRRILKFGIIIRVVFCLACAVMQSCAYAQTKDEVTGSREKYNIALIVVNALRADHLGCYGYSRSTSVFIDKFAQDSVVFDRAYAQSYWTLPSLTTILTSKYVSAHNLDSRNAKLQKDIRTLPEVLKTYGYITAAFTCGLDSAAAFGLNRGFDIYNEYKGRKVVGSLSDMMPKALKWLNENKDKKFFLFLQSYDAHPPYLNPAKDDFSQSYNGIFKKVKLDYNKLKNINNKVFYFKKRKVYLSEDDINYVIGRYDDCLRSVDHFIEEFMHTLERQKLADNTIVIICGDHGEELGERGTFNRFVNQNLYQEVIRVPLIIRHPALLKRQVKRVNSLVGLVDIMPTVLDLLGIPLEVGGQGKSFSQLMEGSVNVTDNYIVSEASKSKWAILRDDGWKLIYSPYREELYNISMDSYERNNLIGSNPDIKGLLIKEFFSWRESHKEEKADNYLKLSSEMVEKLRAAGYW